MLWHVSRRLLAPALALLAACTHAPPPRPVEAPRDPQTELRELVARTYEAVEAADADRLVELFTADAMVFGLGPTDTLNFRDSLIDRARKELVPVGLKTTPLHLEPAHLVVTLAEGGQSGFVSDAPRVLVGLKGEARTFLPRLTAHAVHEGEHWRFDALHVSLGVNDDDLYAADAARRFVPPTDVVAERGKDADQLIGLTRRLLEDLLVKAERTSLRADVVLLGTSPTDLYEGGAAFKSFVKQNEAAIKKAVFSLKIDGNLRARLAPDGKSGWVAATVVLRLGQGRKQQTLPAFRALWTFVEEGGLWNLLSEHQSLGLKPDQRVPATAEQLKAFDARKPPADLPSAPPPAPTEKKKPGKDSDIGAW
jgi:hypothetical protein